MSWVGRKASCSIGINVKLGGTQSHLEVREATVAHSAAEKEDDPCVPAAGEQVPHGDIKQNPKGKSQQRTEETQAGHGSNQTPISLGSRYCPKGALFHAHWIGSCEVVILWPKSITILRGDLGIFLPGYTKHTETHKLPHKYVIDQGENRVLFLHQKYFPHNSHVSNYIFFLKWHTPRFSHIPPIDSNESLMARTANSFFQNMVGGSNFYFNRPRVVRKTEN